MNPFYKYQDYVMDIETGFCGFVTAYAHHYNTIPDMYLVEKDGKRKWVAENMIAFCRRERHA